MLSIIVPVYNAEKYISRCIDSILSQPFHDWELLLIDDGSNDNSLTICKKYAKTDNRIKVFMKENGGVSSARNCGLDNATGFWITFVDADDWLEPNTINKEIFDEQYDIIRIPCSFSTSGIVYDQNIYIVGHNKATKFLRSNYCNACWGRIYKKEVIGATRFNKQIRMGEDILFLVELSPKINSLYIIGGRSGYVYCDNQDSASHTLGYMADFDLLCKELIRLSKKNSLASYVLMSTCYGIAHRNSIVKDFYKCFKKSDWIYMSYPLHFKLRALMRPIIDYLKTYKANLTYKRKWHHS